MSGLRAFSEAGKEIINDSPRTAGKCLNEPCRASQKHLCNTCKHSDKSYAEEPCKSCVPEKLGGPDRWEATNGKE